MGLGKALIIGLAMLTLSAFSLASAGTPFDMTVTPYVALDSNTSQCTYYYGYGKCDVSNAYCEGILDAGLEKKINLGDVCKMNDPPKVNEDSAWDIVAFEGQKVTINAACVDDDPVNTTYTGWTSKKLTFASFDDAGTYRQHLTCVDSFGEKAEAEFSISIINVNRKPVFRMVDWEVTPAITH